MLIKSETSPDGKDKSDASIGGSKKEDDFGAATCLDKTEAARSVPFELYKRRTTVFVMRETFFDIVCNALAEYKYVGPNQRADLVLACR